MTTNGNPVGRGQIVDACQVCGDYAPSGRCPAHSLEAAACCLIAASGHSCEHQEVAELRARLAEVEALCERSNEYANLSGWVRASRVLRAARGEGDR